MKATYAHLRGMVIALRLGDQVPAPTYRARSAFLGRTAQEVPEVSGVWLQDFFAQHFPPGPTLLER